MIVGTAAVWARAHGLPMVCPWSPYGLAMTGSLRQRAADSWELRVYLGVEHDSGRERWASKTVHGSRRHATACLGEFVEDAAFTRLRAGTTVKRVPELDRFDLYRILQSDFCVLSWYDSARSASRSPITVLSGHGRCPLQRTDRQALAPRSEWCTSWLMSWPARAGSTRPSSTCRSAARRPRGERFYSPRSWPPAARASSRTALSARW